MVNINKQIINGLPKTPYRNGVNEWEGIIAHSTDDLDATAQNIRDFESHTWNNAFVHFAVDWNGIIQIAPIEYKCYGAGSEGNKRYISVEMCETNDADKFKKSYDNMVDLFVYLLKMKGFGVDKIFTHADITRLFPGTTTHQDPISYWKSHGVTVEEFKNDVNKKLHPVVKTQAVSHRLVVVDVDNLNIRKIPSWSQSAVCGTVKKGDAFTIINELPEFYQIKSGFYITKSKKYVHVKNI
jgi:N-acetylmuramoyl-L-alanine amidase